MLTFVLYATLSVEQFALWAITNSLLFILLLWSDGGFKKSIPRFFPLLQAEKEFYLRRLSILAAVRIGVLVCTIPILYMALLHFNTTTTPLWLICSVYATEGIAQLLQLMYHAQFLNKTFNMLRSTLLVGETVAILFIISYYSTANPIMIIFGVKLCATSMLIVLASISLFFISPVIVEQAYIDTFSWEEFLRHSCIMWITGILKSLSERNIIVPILAATLGNSSASIFKVAQDGALLLQRTIVKTLGSAGTAFLSYSKENGKALVPALETLFKTTISMSIPLAFCIGFIGIKLYNSTQLVLIQLFFMMLFCYLIELLFLGYETFLEVQQYYKELCYAYLPYCAGLIVLWYALCMHHIDLLACSVILNALRLISMFFMMQATQAKITFIYPYKLGLQVMWKTIKILGLLAITL